MNFTKFKTTLCLLPFILFAALFWPSSSIAHGTWRWQGLPGGSCDGWPRGNPAPPAVNQYSDYMFAIGANGNDARITCQLVSEDQFDASKVKFVSAVLSYGRFSSSQPSDLRVRVCIRKASNQLTCGAQQPLNSPYASSVSIIPNLPVISQGTRSVFLEFYAGNDTWAQVEHIDAYWW